MPDTPKNVATSENSAGFEGVILELSDLIFECMDFAVASIMTNNCVWDAERQTRAVGSKCPWTAASVKDAPHWLIPVTTDMLRIWALHSMACYFLTLSVINQNHYRE